jgi:hypothetical protein
MVDGHMMAGNAHTSRLMDLVSAPAGVTWRAGETELEIMERYYTGNARLPESWDYESAPGDGGPRVPRSEIIIKREFKPRGFTHVLGWDPARPARVLTGAGPGQAFNVIAQRMLTHRECARIMGFPDWWRIQTWKDVPGAGSYWGKQTSVHPAAWISFWAHQALLGQPGSMRGDPGPNGSTVVNLTHAWKRVAKTSA